MSYNKRLSVKGCSHELMEIELMGWFLGVMLVCEAILTVQASLAVSLKTDINIGWPVSGLVLTCKE